MLIKIDKATIEIEVEEDGYFIANAKTIDGRNVTSCEWFVTESELLRALETIASDDFWSEA